MPETFESERLILRPWQQRDFAPFAALNADPRVMKHFPGVTTGTQSNVLVERFQERQARGVISFSAVERKSDGAFIGLAGLSRPGVNLPIGPCVEIGWRLAFEHWGQGYATEAALAWLALGFTDMGLDEIVAFTVPGNDRSVAVMKRIGLRRDRARDFEHPALPQGHRLRPHLLYAITHEAWQAT